jgi:hypothetical protein
MEPQRNGPSPAETFLTESDLAARQNRSVKGIQKDRVAGGGVPFVKFGRTVRYRLSDVVAFENAHLRRSTSDRGGVA